MINPHPSEQAERVRELLQELLAPICTARKLDQLAKLNVAEVARDAWRDFLAENPELEADAWWCSPEVTGALDSLIVAVLGDDEGATEDSLQVSSDSGQATDSDVLTMASMEKLLGRWLSEWYRQLCAIDPLAAEMVLLRLRGFGDRAISEGLESGLRLVNRIVTDIRVGRMVAVETKAKEVA